MLWHLALFGIVGFELASNTLKTVKGYGLNVYNMASE